MTKIFISYRRQDTRQIAGRIFDRLETKFGHDHVFMDIDSIPWGVDFHAFLSEKVGQAETVLALIGQGWADASDEAGNRRLDNPNDFVRIEIEAALERGIPLGAVLIDGAPMPRPEQLPETMRALKRRNAVFVDSGRDFNTHMNRLIADLERHLNGGFGTAPISQPTRKQNAEDRYRAEGRIKVDASIVTNDDGPWFLPGAGKTEWFKDFEDGPEMVVVPAGKFLMGSPLDEPGRQDREGPQHWVTISKPFAIGRFPITFAEWDAAVAAGGVDRKPEDQGWGRGDRPAINVSWDDAQAYLEWLNTVTGKDYRLSSEAEWEYACRSGTPTPFWWGTTITPDQANYDGNYPYAGGKKGQYREQTLPVKSFDPNPWGLYQTHGNVWEWCADAPRHYSATNVADPVGPLDGTLRALRGGSWDFNARYVRAAYRYADARDYRSYYFGFRCARVL